MEDIINKIRNVLDVPTQKEELLFDDKTNSYKAHLDIEKKLLYGYYFDLRKKIGSDYYLLDISLRILNKPISNIANNIKCEAINNRKEIPISLKKKLIRDIRNNETLTGLYRWNEIDIVFHKKITIWSCSIYNLEELNDYKSQLLTLFEKGQEWIRGANEWDFLIDWAFNHDNSLQALSILKYLDRRDEFILRKEEAIHEYEKKKYPTDELSIISI